MRMCYTHRRIMARLALELISEGDTAKAEEVLRYTAKQIPSYNVPSNYSSGSLDMARAWVLLDKKKEALSLINELWKTSSEYMKWYCTLNGSRLESSANEVAVQMYIMQQLIALADSFDQQWADSHMKELGEMAAVYEQKGGELGF